ncbi:hypothetical protein CMQ_7398 [Grosmannia clavigera kw1407]|uniref:Uncharacterized protein n=1 Tax=Grosmannia clavigera (strain kw1407 / UAMH 11150) TaxID=655863 RepID=F0XPX5_GROCL|nr:uncharacterized protein CMQ_7398 [Grosmannia clavigera kw1407]EFX00396.1 hypothetical protein CMQ_7398 [Grosmannia clavigera kw1407]
MLDENLPTFLFRPMPDTPSSAVVYFTRSGSDPTPEYVLRLADPISKPACRGLYAAALTDPYNCGDVVYGEVAVSPQWQQPVLSAAELRDLRGRQGSDPTTTSATTSFSTAAAPIAKVPDSFSVQLYNPDQAVVFRWNPGGWNKTDSWEFDVPIQSFRLPSASRLDREPASSSTAPSSSTASSTPGPASTAAALVPRSTFRWKRDGRLGNKDMTCYLVGKTNAAYHRGNKEPDITIALFKHGRDRALTIYEPNLHRVDVQDRKGLELLLLLGAEVIRDLYLVPRSDPFNLEGAAAAAAASTAAVVRRQDSRDPAPPPGRASTIPASSSAAATAAATPSAAAIDAETKRLQALLEREERERDRRLREEEKRIKMMLEAEEKEQRQREAEIAKETERLRKMYGVEGQDLPSDRRPDAVPSPDASLPPPPPPPPPTAGHLASQQQSGPHLPSRPVSAGSRPTAPDTHTSPGGCSRTGNGVSGFLSAHRNRLAAQLEDGRSRIHKKRSVQF